MDNSTYLIGRTSLFLFLLLYLCGRITLLIHEFMGHALVVTYLGHQIHLVTFQYFGDAWINYHYTSLFQQGHETAILAAGVLSEIVAALLILLVSRLTRSQYIQFLLTFLAAILIIHALHYSIMGLYFQYGDGRYFNQIWGEDLSKWLAVSLLAPLACFCFFFSREYALSLMSLFHCKPVLYLGISSLIAIAFHLLLALGEQNLKASTIHQKIFTPQYISEIQQELKEKEPLQLSEHKKQEIILKHTPFDLKWVLYPLMLSSMLAGYLFSKEPPFRLSHDKLYLKQLGLTCACTLMALVSINAIF